MRFQESLLVVPELLAQLRVRENCQIGPRGRILNTCTKGCQMLFPVNRKGRRP